MASHLRRAAALAPSSAEVYRRLGGLLAVGGKYDDAEKSLLRAFELAKDPLTALNLGALYQAQERHDQAAKLFQAVLDAQPDAYEAAWRLAISRKALGDGKGMAAALQRFLEVAGRIPDQAPRVEEAQKALAALRQPRPSLPAGLPFAAPAGPPASPEPAAGGPDTATP